MVIDAAKVAAMSTCILAVASRFVAAPEDNFVWARPATGEIVDRAAYMAVVAAGAK